MSTATEPSRTAGENLERLLVFAKRGLAFWRRALVVFVVILLGAVPWALLRPRLYKSETVVLYQETIRSSDLTGGEAATESARRVGARLREMLVSRASLEPIVNDLPRYRAIADARGNVDAVDEMRKHISFRAREGDTFEIGFEGASPEEVQDVTRRLGERIVQEASSRRAEQAKALKEFLEAESERNKAVLKENEGELARFLALHPEFALFRPNDPRPAAIPPTSATKDPMLAALEARAIAIDRQLRTASAGGAPAEPRAPTTTPQETAELVAARKELADKLALYTDKHPDVIAARNRVRAAELAVPHDAPPAAPAPDEEPATIKQLTDAERESLRQQLAELNVQIAVRRSMVRAAVTTAPAASASAGAGAPAETHAAVTLEVEYRRLQREVDDLREQQRHLDDKRFKASITASSVMSDRNIQVSILDPAYRPSHPISRSRSVNLAMGIVFAVALSLLTAILSAVLDDRIHERADLEVLAILPVVGVIPRDLELRSSD